MTHVSRNYADQIAKDRSKIVDEIIRRDGPTPPTTTMEEANTAELANKLADAAARWRTKEFDDLCHANTDVIIEALRNAPTIIRLLEAVDGAEKALEEIDAFNTPSPQHAWGAVLDMKEVARQALATLRAAREGAR